MNEQAKKLEREAMFWTLWKHRELHRNDVATRKRGNRFDNNDPCIELSVQVKPLLIDLEGYGESYADRAEGASHRERLSEEAPKGDATVRPTQRKVWKLAEMTNSLIRGVTTWLRHTAGCSFKGKTSYKSWVIDLEAYNYANAA